MAAEIKTYKQYIFKNGQYRKTASGGAEVRVVDVLPTVGEENVLYVLDGSELTPTKKSTKRNTLLFPTCFSFDDIPSGEESIANKLEISTFLNTEIFDIYPFDFENHNYWWAFGHRKTANRDMYLKRQGVYSQNFISPQEFKKCRKHYISEITASPTWRDFLVLTFGEELLNYISGNSVEISLKYCTSKESSTHTRDSLRISIPLGTKSSENEANLARIFANNNLNFSHHRRTRLIEDQQFYYKWTTPARGLVYLVSDVTSFTKDDEVEQYIPGHVVSRLALSDVFICNDDDKDYYYLNISFQKLGIPTFIEASYYEYF